MPRAASSGVERGSSEEEENVSRRSRVSSTESQGNYIYD